MRALRTRRRAYSRTDQRRPRLIARVVVGDWSFLAGRAGALPLLRARPPPRGRDHADSLFRSASNCSTIPACGSWPTTSGVGDVASSASACMPTPAAFRGRHRRVLTYHRRAATRLRSSHSHFARRVRTWPKQDETADGARVSELSLWLLWSTHYLCRGWSSLAPLNSSGASASSDGWDGSAWPDGSRVSGAWS